MDIQYSIRSFWVLVMPFGLMNAPAISQALVNDVLWVFLNQFWFVYIYNILIFSWSMEEHVGHVWRVLVKLLENKLFVKAENCNFHIKSVPFLGIIIQGGSMKADPGEDQSLGGMADTNKSGVTMFPGFH